ATLDTAATTPADRSAGRTPAPRPVDDPAAPRRRTTAVTRTRATSVTRLQYCGEYVLLVSKPPDASWRPRFFDNSAHPEDVWGYCGRLPGTEASRIRIHAFATGFHC